MSRYNQKLARPLKRKLLGAMFGAVIFGGLMACSPSGENMDAANSKMNSAAQMVPFDASSEWINVKEAGVQTIGAPHLILLPGLASSAQTWAPVIEALGETHHLHIVDVSGFAGTPPPQSGKSDIIDGLVADISAYIISNELKNVTIMGHSMGGFTALKTARRIGPHLDKIIIVDSLPYYPAVFNPRASAETMRLLAAQMRDQIIAMDNEAFESFQSQSVARMSKGAKTQIEILQWTVDSDRLVMANALHDLMTQDMRPVLAEISTTTYVIYAWDAMMGMPAAQLEDMYKTQYSGLEGVQFTRIDESFHFIMRDQPDAFLGAARSILDNKTGDR